jgi:hypothetical protein
VALLFMLLLLWQIVVVKQRHQELLHAVPASPIVH